MPRRRNAWRFGAVSLLGLALTVAVARGAEAAGASWLAGIAAVVCCVPAFTFVMHRRWTYR